MFYLNKFKKIAVTLFILLYFVIYISQSDLQEFIKTLALSFGRWLETEDG